MELLGYQLVRSEDWPTGELNGDMNYFFNIGVAKDVRKVTSDSFNSRGLYVLTCAAMTEPKPAHPRVSAGDA